MPTVPLRTPAGTEIAFTYEGDEPGLDSPGGVVLSLLMAQVEQDRERCLACITAGSQGLVPPDATPPAPFFADATVRITGVQVSGDSATVDFSIGGESSEGQALSNAMVCHREGGEWRVDMIATMARMMSTLGDVLEAGQGMLGALGVAVDGLAEQWHRAESAAPDERDGAR